MWNHAIRLSTDSKEVWDGERTRTGAHWTQPCVSSYRVRRCLWKSVQMACLSTTKRELPIQSSCAIIYSISLLFLKWWTQTSARQRPVVDRSRTKSTYPIETICFYTQLLVSKFHLPPPLNVASHHCVRDWILESRAYYEEFAAKEKTETEPSPLHAVQKRPAQGQGKDEAALPGDDPSEESLQ